MKWEKDTKSFQNSRNAWCVFDYGQNTTIVYVGARCVLFLNAKQKVNLIWLKGQIKVSYEKMNVRDLNDTCLGQLVNGNIMQKWGGKFSLCPISIIIVNRSRKRKLYQNTYLPATVNLTFVPFDNIFNNNYLCKNERCCTKW